MTRRRIFEWGGVAAGVVLIAFGIGSLVLSMNGRSDVRDALAQENITGTPDMTPDAIAAAAQEAGLTDVALPTCTVADESVDTGDEARCFASYMRIHALEATGGQTYAEMGRYLDESGNPTSDSAAAAKNPETGQPVENPQRQLWVTETALATALNVSYLAENLAIFGMVVGVALILSGIGFLVLSLGGALRGMEESKAAKAKASPTPA
jgi:hypothetical protein